MWREGVAVVTGIAMTEVMSGFTVGANLDWTVLHVAKECRNLVYVQKLNRRVAQRDQFGFAAPF